MKEINFTKSQTLAHSCRILKSVQMGVRTNMVGTGNQLLSPCSTMISGETVKIVQFLPYGRSNASV